MAFIASHRPYSTNIHVATTRFKTSVSPPQTFFSDLPDFLWHAHTPSRIHAARSAFIAFIAFMGAMTTGCTKLVSGAREAWPE